MRWTEGFIAVDWGTTNRRAYRFAPEGRSATAIEDRFEDHKGILAVGSGEFPAAVAEIRQRLGDLPILLAGMIGSNRGWKETPYVSCPVGLDQIAGGLVWVSEREAIVPGVSYSADGRADVMRGEEVQLLGAVAASMVDADQLVCHPGTHNKWATLRNGKITEFRTVMTGEIFSLLKDHSILSSILGGSVEPNDMFRHAARSSFNDGALLAELFGVRARVLLGQAKKEDAASIASGLLIGADVRIGLANPTDAPISVIGRDDLTQLYAMAIGETGRTAKELDGEQCFIAGIQEIAWRIQ